MKGAPGDCEKIKSIKELVRGDADLVFKRLNRSRYCQLDISVLTFCTQLSRF